MVINGVTVHDPASLSVVEQDLDSDNTNRDETGQMHRDRVRQGIRKVSVKWTVLAQSDAAAILAAVSPASFNVAYIDPESATLQTRTMYVGDRTSDVVATQLGKRWNLSFDLIEY